MSFLMILPSGPVPGRDAKIAHMRADCWFLQEINTMILKCKFLKVLYQRPSEGVTHCITPVPQHSRFCQLLIIIHTECSHLIYSRSFLCNYSKYSC